MGLFGLALDGNPGPKHQLFVADMNGRILTRRPGQARRPRRRSSRRSRPTAGSPATGCSRCGTTSSSTRPATSTSPTTSRGSGGCRPDGTAHIWFTDPRLTGLFGFAGGPLGGRIDPTGQWLYISITIAAEFARADSTIYRIRLVDHPTAADMQLVHRFAVSDPTRRPAAGDRASRSRSRATSTSACSGRTRSRSSTRPATRSAGSPIRGSTRRGAWRSSATRCSSRTATSSRATTPTPGRSSRSPSGSRACR